MPVRAGIHEAIATAVARQVPELLKISHQVSDFAELGLQEFRSSELLAHAAETLPGVSVARGIAGLPTAFEARAGSGSFRVTLCCEYDALPEIGHGCGHNVIAAASFGAFCALAQIADQLDLSVQLLGTPAEETVGGKINLLDAGYFDNTNLVLMVHPNGLDEVSMNPYACGEVTARFIGRAAHASYAPHKGVNALDAMTITLTAIGLARQQLEPNQQIHGDLTERGGASNVIPASAAASWSVRAPDIASLDRVTAVLERCIRAGALATGCELELHGLGDGSDLDPRYANIRYDHDIAELYRQNAVRLGRAPQPLGSYGGSTDMGNVSQVVPSLHPMIGLGDSSLVLHTQEFAQAARGGQGNRAVHDGALLLAQTAVDAVLNPAIRERLTSSSPLAPEDR